MSARTVSPIQATLEQLHQRFAGLADGKVADYIPELAKADPRRFGIAIATVDGQVYEVGDTRHGFTIQSVSKPLVYGAALEDRGTARVMQAIGVEPSGEAFNSISLEAGTGRPLNPMINAGAIAAAGLIAGAAPADRLARVLGVISTYAGRPLAIDDAVFESERSTGHRNRAIGHLLRNYDIIEGDPEPALDLYFRQCSVLLDCRDLALVGATLANGGVNPVTGQRAVAAEHIRAILSVMTTCGVYDFTGEWVYRVGMPAKSGVGGGIVAVLPGQLGIAVYSPALDERGNSVRGVKVFEALSAELGLHVLLPPRAAQASLRSEATLARRRSKRKRTPDEAQVLDAHGHRVQVLELQGDLRFSTIEPLLRHVHEADDETLVFVLDFKRVSHADATATRLLARLVESCAARGQQVLLSRVRRDLLADFGSELAPRHARAVRFEPQLDGALESSERVLLERYRPERPALAAHGLAAHRLCAGMAQADVALLESQLERAVYDPGSFVVNKGDAADTLFLVMRGEASVVIELPAGTWRRLSTLSAGMSFGESALMAGAVRTADVRADTPLECLKLPAATLARLEQEHPRLALRLLRNLLASSNETAGRLTAEVAALEG